MPVIKVETPDGVQQVEIKGNTPTPQETAAIKKQFFSKTQTKSVQPETDRTGAFVSGLRKGFKTGKNPLKTAGDAIADKFNNAGDEYEKNNPTDKDKDKDKGKNSTDTRAGLNTLRSELGLENPAMAVKALEKLQAGKPLSNKNELNAVKPIINAVQAALQSTQGRARLKQLIKTLS
jgi:hypothetical protein